MIDAIKQLNFDIRTIKWISHRENGSDYDNGWNDALNTLNIELSKIIEDFRSRTCENCKFYGTEHERVYHPNYRTCINKDSFTYMDEPHLKDGCNKFERETDE